MTGDPYLYPRTQTLRNKFDIRDPERLEQAEPMITTAAMGLALDPVPEITPEGLQRIHRHIFGNIYPWAGEFRTIGIQKIVTDEKTVAFERGPLVRPAVNMSSIPSNIPSCSHKIGPRVKIRSTAMKSPQHPARPDFDKAADADEARRQQQIVALTPPQRRAFDDAQVKSAERIKVKENEQADRFEAEVQERTRQKLLESRLLELHPPGLGRTKVSDEIVKRAMADLAKPADTPRTHLAGIALGMAQAAQEEIRREHKLEADNFRYHERGKTDALLRSFEKARETEIGGRADFAHAAAKGQAKADFGKAALNPDEKSAAIARAIARVRQKEERERQSRDRDPGRER